MLKKIVLAAAASMVLMAPAYAADCSGDLATIDTAMAAAKVSQADKATAMELRKQGASQIKAGDQNGACKTLKMAKLKLGLK